MFGPENGEEGSEVAPCGTSPDRLEVLAVRCPGGMTPTLDMAANTCGSELHHLDLEDLEATNV